MASIGDQESEFGPTETQAGGRPRAFERIATALADSLKAERDRWVLWLPAGLGCGIGIYFLLPVEPPLSSGFFGLISILLGALIWRRAVGGILVAFALGSVLLGFTVAQMRTALVAAPVIQKRIGPVEVTGRVLEAPPRAAGGRVILGSLSIAGLNAPSLPDKARVRLTLRDPVRLSPGDWIKLRAVLRPPPEPAAPGAFDFARQVFFVRIGAVGYAVSHAKLANGPERQGAADAQGTFASWQLKWAAWRKAVGERVLAHLPGPAGGVATALMTGDRSAIPESVIEAMRGAGLAHLLAISGLHMGLVAGFLFFAVRALLACFPAIALRYPIKKLAAVAAWPGALAYLLLVGATVPSQRAFLMVSLVLLAVLLDRKAISLRLVAWAALAVLLVAPESLLTASFQMSFAAVTALVAAYEVIEGRFLGRAGSRSVPGRLGLYLAGVALTSVIAIAATAPFAVYHFNRVATFGLIANLAAVPLTAFWVMPCAVLAYLLMPLGLEGLALAPMGWGVSAILEVAETVAGLPGAVQPVAAVPFLGFLCAVLGGLWLCLWRGPWRLFGLGAILCGLLFAAWDQRPDVLVSGDGRLVALRGADESLWLSSTRRAAFQAELWLRRSGQETGKAWPLAEEDAAAPMLCDSSGCVLRTKEQVVAVALTGAALDEDCRRASVLIALEPLRWRACPAPKLIIDRFDLWREGAHALWIGPHGLRVKSVARERGRRPWVLVKTVSRKPSGPR